MIREALLRLLARYRPCGGPAPQADDRQAAIDALRVQQARIEREITVLEAQARGVRARRGHINHAGAHRGQ